MICPKQITYRDTYTHRRAPGNIVMSSPPEILFDQKIFHICQPCPYEYVLVCYFVHPGYPHN